MNQLISYKYYQLIYCIFSQLFKTWNLLFNLAKHLTISNAKVMLKTMKLLRSFY